MKHLVVEVSHAQYRELHGNIRLWKVECWLASQEQVKLYSLKQEPNWGDRLVLFVQVSDNGKGSGSSLRGVREVTQKE